MAGGAFSARSFFPTPIADLNRTPANAQRADVFGDSTPPSAVISLHQKLLDLVLSSSIEQKAAIDELKRENDGLKQQLQDVSTELQALKETEKQLGTSRRSSSKLPTAVSVS